MKKNVALGASPLDPQDAIMDRTFYRRRGRPPASTGPNGGASVSPLARTQVAREKPTHYKIVSISLYTEDIEHLEEMVSALKAKGYTKANKSQLIRYALSTVDLEKMPKTL